MKGVFLFVLLSLFLGALASSCTDQCDVAGAVCFTVSSLVLLIIIYVID